MTEWNHKLREARWRVFAARAMRQGRVFLGFAGIKHAPIYLDPESLPPEQQRELDIAFMKDLTGVRQDN